MIVKVKLKELRNIVRVSADLEVIFEGTTVPCRLSIPAGVKRVTYYHWKFQLGAEPPSNIFVAKSRPGLGGLRACGFAALTLGPFGLATRAHRAQPPTWIQTNLGDEVAKPNRWLD